MKKVPETKIGNLSILTEAPAAKAILHCFCAEAALLSIDLLDEKGRSYLHQKAQLPPGPHKESLNISRLKPGRYNAWISLGQTSAIRQLHIPEPTGLSSRLKKFLKGKK